MKATTVKDVLIASKWLIDRYGWCQVYSYTSTDGEGFNEAERIFSGEKTLASACLNGAIHLVETDSSVLLQTINLIRDEVDGYPMWYNDCVCKSKEQVIALLDKLIAKA
jgi:hypothetical protein